MKFALLFVFILFFVISVQSFYPQGKAENSLPVSTTIIHSRITTDYINSKGAHNARINVDFPESNNSESDNNFQILSNHFSRNYFHIDKSIRSLWNGKHWNQPDFPLKVYIKESESRNFKAIYKRYIDYAFQIWGKADSRIKFKYVSDVSDANITIDFEDNLMEKYKDSYMGLTDYSFAGNNKIKLSTVEIGLKKMDGEKMSDGEVKATIIHELGHAIGLGHSDNDTDIMFPYINPDSSPAMNFHDLSSGDVDAIKSVVDLGFKNQFTKK